MELQWGHDQLIVEGVLISGLERAGMTWLQWGHDQLIVEGAVRRAK